ncbi:MAG: PulJ/GspJ family protein [Chlamydiia bacterium]
MDCRVKAKKGFSLLETMISTVLITILFAILSQLIVFVLSSSKSLEFSMKNNHTTNVLNLIRMIDTISFENHPIELDPSIPELKFAFVPDPAITKKEKLLFVHVFYEKGDLVVQKRDKKGEVLEEFFLAKKIPKPTISLFVFEQREKKKNHFTQIFKTDRATPFIPKAIRFEAEGFACDLDIPLILKNNQLLELDVTPTTAS